MKVCILLGTRPEIIKMAPLIRACEDRDIDYYILHTGQHYSYEMDKKICDELEIPIPKYNLKVGGQSYRKQVGMMIREIMQVLEKDTPDIIFVQGDTNSVLAGALAANKLGIPIGHHEAGLRSHDTTMLEETNRIITDHIADFLFAPTKDALKNLRDEGLAENKIHYTGNTVVDAVQQNLKLANKKKDILKDIGVEKGNYVLVTAHRAENVDNIDKLNGIFDGLILLEQYLKLPIVYPIHPRTRKKVEEYKIDVPENIKLIEPVGYLEFLQLEGHAKLIVTDSGGIQEEACILQVPCVTIRENTERPETLTSGANILAGTEPKKILNACQEILKKKNKWENPFGDGHAGDRILRAWLKNANTD
ncbi:MAG: non-hydrolyzing UDP-N-acetylglucosamine 2-epimerase [Candidatus Nanoarchaeia archaeon]